MEKDSISICCLRLSIPEVLYMYLIGKNSLTPHLKEMTYRHAKLMKLYKLHDDCYVLPAVV